MSHEQPQIETGEASLRTVSEQDKKLVFSLTPEEIGGLFEAKVKAQAILLARYVIAGLARKSNLSPEEIANERERLSIEWLGSDPETPRFPKILGDLVDKASREEAGSITADQKNEAVRFTKALIELSHASLPTYVATGFALVLEPEQARLADQIQAQLHEREMASEHAPSGIPTLAQPALH